LCHVCDVEAYGDGVSQVAVESMDFSLITHCLVSVGEGRTCIKLWDVNEHGKVSWQWLLSLVCVDSKV
jgi:hypothetical protein